MEARQEQAGLSANLALADQLLLTGKTALFYRNLKCVRTLLVLMFLIAAQSIQSLCMSTLSL
jgi:hypothetical protein